MKNKRVWTMLVVAVASVLAFTAATEIPVQNREGGPSTSQYHRIVFDAPGGNIDMFNRLRASAPHTVFDSKQIFDKDSLFWSERVVNTSGSASSVVTTPVWQFNVAANDTIIRQTRTWWNYQPGKSQLILMTAVLSTDAGMKQRLGQFNDTNGMYFEVDSGTFYVATRNNGVSQRIPQSQFSDDTMNGSGLSEVTLDLTKAQIYFINYEWLGVGTTNFGVIHDGIPIVMHQWHHANLDTSTYTRTPNLPLRYEATKSTAGVSRMKTICSTVISEGGQPGNGVVRSASTNGTHLDANAIDTAYVVMAMKLAPGRLGATVRVEAVDLVAETNTTTGEWFLAINPTVQGSLTFVQEPNSSVMIARGGTANIINGKGLGQIGGGQMSQSTRSAGGQLPDAWALGCKVDSTQADTLVFGFRPGTSNADVQGTLTWRELR